MIMGGLRNAVGAVLITPALAMGVPAVAGAEGQIDLKRADEIITQYDLSMPEDVAKVNTEVRAMLEILNTECVDSDNIKIAFRNNLANLRAAVATEKAAIAEQDRKVAEQDRKVAEQAYLEAQARANAAVQKAVFDLNNVGNNN